MIEPPPPFHKAILATNAASVTNATDQASGSRLRLRVYGRRRVGKGSVRESAEQDQCDDGNAKDNRAEAQKYVDGPTTLAWRSGIGRTAPDEAGDRVEGEADPYRDVGPLCSLGGELGAEASDPDGHGQGRESSSGPSKLRPLSGQVCALLR